MSPVPTWMREQMRGPDVRIVELGGHELAQPFGVDGQLRMDVECPYCLTGTCWVIFASDGKGRFLCKPCGSMGSAEHDEYMGRREIQLTLESQVDDADNWTH